MLEMLFHVLKFNDTFLRLIKFCNMNLVSELLDDFHSLFLGIQIGGIIVFRFSVYIVHKFNIVSIIYVYRL